MPVRDEAAFIERSLGSVLGQDYPKDRLEVIVADGMSVDATRDIIESFLPLHPYIRIVDNPGRTAPHGLNIATGAATGDILVRVDGHCEIAPDYVRNCVRHILEDGIDAVGGAVETVGETPVAQAIAMAMSSRFGVGDSMFRTHTGGDVLADTVPFPAYTREIVERAGPYDVEQVRNQDDEYNYRIRAMGGKILLAADVGSRYYSRSSLRSLWRQYFQYGFWKVRVAQKHPRQMRARQFVPPLFVAGLASSALGAPFSRSARTVLALTAGSYACANLAWSTRAAVRRGRSHLRLLPVVFATLHLSYGAGFLMGLLRFARLWRAPVDGQ